MMIVPMDKMSAPPSRECAQRLYEKNLELENKRRRSAQARVPSDPNAWQQMRENYEAIVLEDHAFSEQHNVEYALWQLHYRRIEELRTHFSTALASTTANTSQGVKGSPRPDRVTKIRLQFKTFLSEATGFYHDLIVKLRARYGLPLNHISEDSENEIAMEKDGKQSAELKKGLVSCHRCLIYLGDLARYKGLYGEADARTREYGAASSYYLQAASICPSSGNPHHQLAILASYSGDELVAIYRYFRSLAVDNPFTTARDNLIVAFEKNRQSFAQLPVDVKEPLLKQSAAPGRLAGKGTGKMEAKFATKDTKRESSPVKDRPKSIQELCKFFCVRFVRLNGLLFTRTSLETFADVLALVTSDLCELLSSGPDEELNFGADSSDNALFVVRLVAILVYTVHNLKREGEGQTYADIVQLAVLLQNGFTAVFQLMGHIVERCLQVHDISSSLLMPGILVFLEWIACCPDVAVPTSDMDEKQSTARSKLWKNCTLFLNKISVAGSMCVDNKEDETCFFSMSRYEEGETENRIALWEDFELRGFLPILPAHSILDFSRKQSVGSDGNKEKKVRVDRILAAGKALVNVIRVDRKTVYFDPKTKKFVIGVEPSEDEALPFSSRPPRVNGVMQDNRAEKVENTILDSMQVNSTLRREGLVDDDDDEVIVFKPVVAEKKMDAIGHSWTRSNGLKRGESNSTDSSNYFSVSVSPPNVSEYSASDPTLALNGGVPPPNLQQVYSNGLNWSAEQGFLANSLKGFALFENGHVAEQKVPASYGFYHPTPHPGAIHQPSLSSNGATIYNQINAPECMLSSTTDAIAGSGFGYENLALKTSTTLPVGGQKSPVGRPARHLGPPPGFSSVSNPLDAMSASDLDTPVMDDYSWLDGYHLTPSMKSAGLNDHVNSISHGNPQYVNTNSNGFSGTVSFPFPGKQHPSMQFQSEKQKVLHDYQTLEQLKLKADQKLLQQQLSNGNQQHIYLPDRCQGQSVWTGQYFV